MQSVPNDVPEQWHRVDGPSTQGPNPGGLPYAPAQAYAQPGYGQPPPGYGPQQAGYGAQAYSQYQVPGTDVGGAAYPGVQVPGKPPGNIILGSALSLVTSSFCGLGGIAVIIVTAMSLHAVTSLFGQETTSVLTGSTTPGGLGNDVFEAVIFGVVFVFLAVALAWGAISAITGTSVGTAVVANIIIAVLLLIAVINVHPLLLVLLAAPIVAIIALLSPSSKDYVRRRAT